MIKRLQKVLLCFLNKKGQGNVPGPFLLLSDRKS